METAVSILAVDDDADMANVLAGVLGQEGYSVQAVTSAAEAERIVLETANITLAVIDVMMPVVDGLTLLECLKRLKLGLAVLMMSGSGLLAAVECFKRGAEDFVAKPCERATLCNKINHILERQSLRDRAAQLGG